MDRKLKWKPEWRTTDRNYHSHLPGVVSTVNALTHAGSTVACNSSSCLLKALTSGTASMRYPYQRSACRLLLLLLASSNLQPQTKTIQLIRKLSKTTLPALIWCRTRVLCITKTEVVSWDDRLFTMSHEDIWIQGASSLWYIDSEIYGLQSSNPNLVTTAIM